MCGISVIYDLGSKEITQSEIEHLNLSIKHRGPDNSEFWKNGKCALAHRRLAIIDLDERSNQPFRFGNYIITFNGEIFNFKELKSELENKGHLFKTDSDTEVLLRMYIEYGNNMLSKLNGMWAFAIYNTASEQLFVARDRFGIKPLYFSKIENRIYFYSEIKQIRNIHALELNEETVLEFLFFGRLHHKEDTIYKNVQLVEPGTFLTIQNNQLKKERYYSIPITDNNRSLDSNLEELKFLLDDSVRIRILADVKVGTLVSGGIDSSLINYYQMKYQSSPECFHFASKKYSEIDYAKMVVEKGKGKLSIINEENTLSDFENMTRIFDEPYNSLSILAQYSIFKKVKERDIKVVLSGQGADEVFLGYDRYKYLNNRLKPQHYVFYNKKINQFYNSFRFGLGRKQRELLKYLDNINTCNNKSLKEFQSDEIMKYQLQQLLYYEDQNSMANSIESRVPFLDHRIVEFGLNLPIAQKIYKGETKYILKRLAEEIYGTDFVKRKKIGFNFDFDQYYNFKNKNQIVDELGSNFQFKEIIEQVDIKKLSNNDWLLWRFECFNILLRKMNAET